MIKRKSMKKIVSILLLMITLISNFSSVFAVSVGQSVDIVSLRECEQHINFRASNGNVGPVTANFVGYYENGKFYPAYCLEANKTGASSDLSYAVSVDSAANNDAVYRVLIKGYPYTSWQDMGLESEDDAFVATKQAIYCVLDNRDVNRYTARDARGQKIVNKIKELADFGKNGSITPYQSVVNVNAVSDAGVDNINNDYISQVFVANTEVTSQNIEVQLNTATAPEGTFLADINNNPKSAFSENEQFKVLVPRNKITSNIKVDFNLRANVKTFPVFFTEAPNETLQDYAIVSDPFTLARNQKSMIYSPKAEIDIEKISNKQSELTGIEEGGKLQGAKFKIEGINVDYVQEVITNIQGKIELSGLKLGKYKITEIESPTFYLKNKNTVYEVELTFDGDNKKVTFENTPVEIKVNIDKNADKKEAQGKEIVTYEIDNIKNLSNVKLENFTLRDDLPKEVRIQKLYTGIYNENLKYSVYYDTNKKQNVKLQENLSTTKDNEIDFTNIKLDKDEYVTSYSLKLGTVKVGFSNTSKMKVETKVIEGLVDKSKFTNNVKVSGTYLDKKTEDKDDVPVTVYENILRINKVSKEYNQYLDLPAGSPIDGTVFEILDENKEHVTTVETANGGLLEYKYLETGKKYYLKEISTAPYYVISKELIEFKFEKNGQILELKVENDNVNLLVDVQKEGPTETEKGKLIDYTFNHVGNFSNIGVSNFIWGDKLPREVRVQELQTGIWNEELEYEIQYITNKNTNWKYIGDKYNTTKNYTIDLTSQGLELDNDEYVVEFRLLFGKVKSGFEASTTPIVKAKVNEDVKNNKIFVNKTYVTAEYEETKLKAKDNAHTIIYTKKTDIDKELPKTGLDY